MTHIVRVVLEMGISLLAYLDDLLIAAHTASLCATHLQTVLHVLADHGWLLNEQKSRFTLSQSFQHLGLDWDLGLFQCSLPELLQTRIRQSIDMLLTPP